jgi:hypothetical protein
MGSLWARAKLIPSTEYSDAKETKEYSGKEKIWYFLIPITV